MLEKDIENKVVSWAQKKGFLTPKVKFAENGWPDRLFISPYGHTIFIEFKRPGEEPSQLQWFRLRELARRRIPAFWTASYEGAIGILQTALEPEDLPAPSYPTPVESSVGRIVSGPWPGKDVDGPRYDKDSDAEEAREAYTDSSPASPRLQGLAGRDREMGGLSPPTVDGTPWDPEGS